MNPSQSCREFPANTLREQCRFLPLLCQHFNHSVSSRRKQRRRRDRRARSAERIVSARSVRHRVRGGVRAHYGREYAERTTERSETREREREREREKSDSEGARDGKERGTQKETGKISQHQENMITLAGIQCSSCCITADTALLSNQHS